MGASNNHKEEAAATAQYRKEADPWSKPAWVADERVAQRCHAWGLTDPKVQAFMANSEAISLGSYCGAAFALQALGLKQRTYPFDWVRSPIEGVIQCISTGFADFLSYKLICDKGEHGTLYGQTSWGGSFWHHDPEDPKIQNDFQRRANRLLGKCSEVSETTQRIFVRIANSTAEILASVRLHRALQDALPDCRVFLLVLIDMQQQPGPVLMPTNDGVDLLFYKVDQALFSNPNLHFAHQMEMSTEAYAQAVACALRIWSADNAGMALSMCSQVPSLEALEASCQAFEAGDPSLELYKPAHTQAGWQSGGIQGRPMVVPPPSPVPSGRDSRRPSVSSRGSVAATPPPMGRTPPMGSLTPSMITPASSLTSVCSVPSMASTATAAPDTCCSYELLAAATPQQWGYGQGQPAMPAVCSVETLRLAPTRLLAPLPADSRQATLNLAPAGVPLSGGVAPVAKPIYVA